MSTDVKVVMSQVRRKM